MKFIPRAQQTVRPVSHDPDLSKLEILPHSLLPGLTTFSVATFAPDTQVSSHCHADMWEVFYVNAGQATFFVDGAEVHTTEGDCVVVEPGDKHSLRSGAESNLVLLYFAIAATPQHGKSTSRQAPLTG